MKRKTAALPLLVLLSMSGSRGQSTDLALVDISPSPDSLVAVDPFNTASVTPLMPITLLGGNYVRGIELTAPATGWYVATASVAGSPTGFMRLDHGVTTLVAPLPFTSPAVGGLSFSPAEDFLYWVSDPDVGDDVLYRIDFNGTFTFLAAISLAGSTSLAITGIAADPVSGVLYAVDSVSDLLLAIDPMTGVATPVGTGLGMPVAGVGGLDFALDGTQRLFLVNGGNLHEVSTATGQAGPMLGFLPFHSSALAGRPGRVTLDSGAAQLNQIHTASLSGGQSGDPFEIWVSDTPGWYQLPPHGVLRIDPFVGFQYGSGMLDLTGRGSVAHLVPNTPSLIGMTFHLQAFTTPASGSSKLTNVEVESVLP